MTAEQILYPHTEGGWPLCRGCFRQGGYTCRDPRTDDLTLLCGGCLAALNEGAPLPLPTGRVLADTWERLARLRQNAREDDPAPVTDETIGDALETLAPHLSPEDGWHAFTLLREMLLRLQDLRSPMADPCAYEGGLEHAEHEAEADRMHALKTLTGGR